MDIAKNDSGVVREGTIMVNGAAVVIRQAARPVVSFYPSWLRCSSTPKGSTGSQEVQIRVNGQGAVTWAQGAVNPNLSLSRASGSAPGWLTVSCSGTALPAGTTITDLRIQFSGADQAELALPVSITVQPEGTLSQPPFGSFDTPVDGTANIAGSIAVTGWALDDVGVERVEIWRDRVGVEAA